MTNFAKSMLSLSLVAIAATAAPAFADTGKSMAVGYHDLNLSTQDGQAVLAKRISRAADAVCAEAKSQDLAMRQAYKACRTQAINSANTAIAAKTSPSTSLATR